MLDRIMSSSSLSSNPCCLGVSWFSYWVPSFLTVVIVYAVEPSGSKSESESLISPKPLSPSIINSRTPFKLIFLCLSIYRNTVKNLLRINIWYIKSHCIRSATYKLKDISQQQNNDRSWMYLKNVLWPRLRRKVL